MKKGFERQVSVNLKEGLCEPIDPEESVQEESVQEESAPSEDTGSNNSFVTAPNGATSNDNMSISPDSPPKLRIVRKKTAKNQDQPNTIRFRRRTKKANNSNDA
jgi:hypothetical protein